MLRVIYKKTKPNRRYFSKPNRNRNRTEPAVFIKTEPKPNRTWKIHSAHPYLPLLVLCNLYLNLDELIVPLRLTVVATLPSWSQIFDICSTLSVWSNLFQVHRNPGILQAFRVLAFIQEAWWPTSMVWPWAICVKSRDGLEAVLSRQRRGKAAMFLTEARQRRGRELEAEARQTKLEARPRRRGRAKSMLFVSFWYHAQCSCSSYVFLLCGQWHVSMKNTTEKFHKLTNTIHTVIVL